MKRWKINSIPATTSIVLRVSGRRYFRIIVFSRLQGCVQAIKGYESEIHLLSIVSRMRVIKP